MVAEFPPPRRPHLLAEGVACDGPCPVKRHTTGRFEFEYCDRANAFSVLAGSLHFYGVMGVSPGAAMIEAHCKTLPCSIRVEINAVPEKPFVHVLELEKELFKIQLKLDIMAQTFKASARLLLRTYRAEETAPQWSEGDWTELSCV